jgi:hypothetical protein
VSAREEAPLAILYKLSCYSTYLLESFMIAVDWSSDASDDSFEAALVLFSE